jgi:hypothetical protein
LRRLRLARSALARRCSRRSASVAIFGGFPPGGRGIVTSPPCPLSTRGGFGYADASASAERRRSSVVERILGKAEVGSSILPDGTRSLIPSQMFFAHRHQLSGVFEILPRVDVGEQGFGRF